MLEKIIELRRDLHQNPELSGHEINTARRIKNFILQNSQAEIIDNIGGNGLVARFKFSETGPRIMLRCELDALPISEKNEMDYKSVNPGISHKCGHDGHMAIISGLAYWLKDQNFNAGEVILVFQPAEETGKGARNMLSDSKFKELKPDYIFALHNLPGKPLNSILIKENYFSATVKSMFVKFTGKECHASEPENGINPALAIAEVIRKFALLNKQDPNDPDFEVLTPVHINMGDKAYGISPRTGEIHYTIRAWKEEVMQKLSNEIKQTIENIANDYKLKTEIDWFEYFPEVKNDTDCNKIIYEAAKNNNLEILNESVPFRFGEDFGWFSRNYKGAMFGLGAGPGHPALHHSDYDFPDEILETGLKMFQQIISEILTND